MPANVVAQKWLLTAYDRFQIEQKTLFVFKYVVNGTKKIGIMNKWSLNRGGQSGKFGCKFSCALILSHLKWLEQYGG